MNEVKGAIVEEIPVLTDLNGPESDDVTVFIEVGDPTEEEILRLYQTYRDGGGDAYEPYESMLIAQRGAQATASS